MRRKGEDLHLITFGQHTYSSDSRYLLEYQAPNDWQLLIQYANERDEGTYSCEVNSHPPLVYIAYLTIVGTYVCPLPPPFWLIPRSIYATPLIALVRGGGVSSAPGGDCGRTWPIDSRQILQSWQHNRVKMCDQQCSSADELRHLEARGSDVEL